MRGQRELRKHLAGERLTMKQMIIAKCFDCMGNYADGKEDCAIPECSLYPMMPYGAIRRKATSRKHIPASPLEAKKGIKEGIHDPISQEYRTSHLRGNFPGQNLGD